MSKFNLRDWFASKGKKAITTVRIPIEGEEKPAQFKLQGLCNPSIDEIAKLAGKQTELIPGNLPPAELDGGVVVKQRASFEAGDFQGMLYQSVGKQQPVQQPNAEELAKKEAEEKAAKEEADRKAKEEANKVTNRGNGQQAVAPGGKR